MPLTRCTCEVLLQRRVVRTRLEAPAPSLGQDGVGVDQPTEGRHGSGELPFVDVARDGARVAAEDLGCLRRENELVEQTFHRDLRVMASSGWSASYGSNLRPPTS